MKLTPILYVERIEPCLPFWVDQLGFVITAEVPEDDHIGFVILVQESTEVMLQTRAGLAKDMPALLPLTGSTMLYLEVEDFHATTSRLTSAEVLHPERTTFYGMRELVVKEPGGNVVIIASPVAK